MTVGTRGVCVWRVEDVECWPDTGVKPIIGRLLIIYINCEEHWSPGTGGPASIDRGQVGLMCREYLGREQRDGNISSETLKTETYLQVANVKVQLHLQC